MEPINFIAPDLKPKSSSDLIAEVRTKLQEELSAIEAEQERLKEARAKLKAQLKKLEE